VIDRVKGIVETTEGARIVRAQPKYPYVRFASQLIEKGIH
jgi:hypothetical protein